MHSQNLAFASAVLLIISFANASELLAKAPILFLEYEPISLESQVRGIVPREIVRQSILIAAHDLGWNTRDAAMREAPPENPESIRLKLELTRAEGLISAALVRKDEAIWNGKFETGDSPDYYQRLLTQMQEQANGELKQSLTKLAPEWKSPQPEQIESIKGWKDNQHEVHLIKQFVTARHWHRALRNQSNVENLSGLARTYANLSLLTRHHWSATSGVFTARSLIYAERAVTNAKAEQPLAGWTRAYCNALCGRHAAALSNVDESKATQDQAVPDWARVVIPCCTFDDSAHETIAADDSVISPIAALLLLEACRSRNNEVLLEKVAMATMQQAPLGTLLYAECAKRDRSFSMRRWASDAGIRAVNGTLRGGFKFSQGFPDETKTALKNIEAEEEQFFPRIGTVTSRLIASSDELEASDLSWSMLGRLLQEEIFVASVGLIADARNAVKTDLSGYTDSILPLLDDHPYRPYIRAWSYDLETERQEFMDAIDQITLIDPRPHMTQLSVLWNTSSSKYKAVGQAAARMALPDFTEHSMGDRAKLLWQLPEYAQSYEKMFGIISPHSPKLLRCTILGTKDYTDEQFAEWKKRAIEEEDSAALLVLHERLRPGDDWADNSRSILEPLLKLEPQVIYARMLAERHLMKGDREAWKKTLADYLEIDSESFESTKIAQDLANRMMTERDWNEAKPYAEIAASTFSAWGLQTLSRCLEGLEEYVESERAVSELTKSYGNSARQHWYLWCKRNDRGDLEAAKQLAAEYYATPRSAVDYESKSVHLQLEGRADDALEAMIQGNKRKPSYWNEMGIALLAYDLKKEETREKALEDLRVRCEGRPTDKLLAQLVQLGQLDDEQEVKTDIIDDYLKPENWDVKCDVAYYAGECLIRLGKEEQATKYLEIARWSEVERLTPTLAAARLRELKAKTK